MNDFKNWKDIEKYLDKDDGKSKYINSVMYNDLRFSKYYADCNDKYCSRCIKAFTSTEEAMNHIQKRCGNLSLIYKIRKDSFQKINDNTLFERHPFSQHQDE